MNRPRDESSSSSVSIASSNGGKAKRNKNSQYIKNPNPNTVEKVRMIMEQEGRSARNLVSWSIPLDSYGPSKGKSSKRKSMNLQRKSLQIRDDIESSRVSNNAEPNTIKKPVANPNRRTGVRKPVNIRARYWAYLFENLRRAVDEIYTTCEGDASVVECKEVLMILDNYQHDFQALIDWLNLQERLENTDIQDRPTSLAWEVRKSSPGRPRQKIISRGVASGPSSNRSTSGNISRCLNFSSPSDAAALVTASAVYRSLTGRIAPTSVPLAKGEVQPQSGSFQKTTTTWADRVKGIKPKPVDTNIQSAHVQVQKTTDVINETSKTKSLERKLSAEDDGEWETVTSKNKQLKLAKSLKQLENKQNDHKNFTGHLKNKADAVHPKPKSPHIATPPSTSSCLNNGGNSYVNIVMDRMIGMEGMKQQGSNSHDIPDASSHASKKVVTFRPDVENMKDPFDDDGNDDKGDDKEHGDNNNITASTESLLANKDYEEDNLILKKLEEEEALLERTLHAEHDASIAVAEQRERDLLRQIQEAKDLETPELDTDCDSARSSAGAKELHGLDNTPQQPLEWADFMARFEAEQAAVAGLSWGELVEEEELREPGRAVQMHEKLSSPSRKRTPAESRRKQEEKHRRAKERRQQMHQERTQKIHELTEKVQEVVTWKNDLIERKRDLLQSFHSEKLARAEEQRAMQLLHIKKKARVEDTKVNEIAFINELQEQNKRHEVLMRIEEHESRIQELELERSKMQEMKSSKEESVKERRRALEKERLDRIEELKVKRQEQIARIEQQKIEKEKEREKLAKERARDREMRLSALNAAQQEAVTELQKKIQLKHDESERRHQVQLEQRKEKALELSLGKFSSLNSSLNASCITAHAQSSLAPTSTNQNCVSKSASMIIDGSSDVVVPGATGDNEEKPVDDIHSTSDESLNSPRNCVDEDLKRKEEEQRRKMMKKRLKKLKSRITSRGQEFLKQFENQTNSTTSNKSRVVRLIKDVCKLVANQKGCSGPWPTNQVAALDRCFGEMNRMMEKQSTLSDQVAFRSNGGFVMLDQLFSSFLEEVKSKDVQILPNRSLGNAAMTFRNACRGCYDNCVYLLFSGKMTSLIDLTSWLVSKNSSNSSSTITRNGSLSKKTESDFVFDIASPSLLFALSAVLYELRHRPSNTDTNNNVSSMLTMTSSKNILEYYLTRGLDVISYIVASGIIEVLSSYFKSIRHKVEPGSSMSRFVSNGLAFLQSLTSFVSMRNRLLLARSNSSKSSKKVKEASTPFTGWDRDPTLLLSALQQTDLMGIVSVLYGLLLHGAPERPTTLRSTSVVDSVSTNSSSDTKSVPEHALNVAIAVFSVLNAVAEMNLPLLQASLAAEGTSLAFRHICTYLLWYCVEREHSDLLHEVIICIGHFTIDNHCNQNLVDSGAQPTVLQQLCSLPFSYFSNPPLMHILLPTLVACCHDNKSNITVLEQEASPTMLIDFIETFLNNESAKGDTKTKSNKKDRLPRSLADISRFDSEFLHRALSFFKSCHVPDDVIEREKSSAS